MFDRILVPVDGSSRDEEAIEAARHLAEGFAAELELLHVEGSLTSLTQVLADNRMLEEQAGHLLQQGVRVHSKIEFGRTDRAIADLARADRAQLIVLAPHHRSRLEALRHPRIVSRLLGHTAAPLLVLPERAADHPDLRMLGLAGALVMVPLDGSELAEQALPYAVAFAHAYARPLLIVYVVPPQTYLGIAPEALLADVDSQTRAEQDAHSYLRAMRGRLVRDQPGLHIQSMILSGEPWRELLRCAQTHDGSLIVMSSHGRGGLARALLGSVAEHLARVCPLPVLIVPSGARVRDQAISALVAGAADAKES